MNKWQQNGIVCWMPVTNANKSSCLFLLVLLCCSCALVHSSLIQMRFDFKVFCVQPSWNSGFFQLFVFFLPVFQSLWLSVRRGKLVIYCRWELLAVSNWKSCCSAWSCQVCSFCQFVCSTYSSSSLLHSATNLLLSHLRILPTLLELHFLQMALFLFPLTKVCRLFHAFTRPFIAFSLHCFSEGRALLVNFFKGIVLNEFHFQKPVCYDHRVAYLCLFPCLFGCVFLGAKVRDAVFSPDGK